MHTPQKVLSLSSHNLTSPLAFSSPNCLILDVACSRCGLYTLIAQSGVTVFMVFVHFPSL